MWRALFLAIGICMMIVGLECLGIDRVYFRAHDDAAVTNPLMALAPRTGTSKQFAPPRWMPWSMLSSGAIVCLYSFTIPRKMAKK
jgi:hypothetical protein